MRKFTDKAILGMANNLEAFFSENIANCCDSKLIVSYDIVLDNILSYIENEWDYDDETDEYYFTINGKPSNPNKLTKEEYLAFIFGNTDRKFTKPITDKEIKRWIDKNS